jgi:transposase-like protein
MDEPMSAIDFQDRFRTEDDCLDYIEKLRWPHGFVCPNCGHDVGYRLSNRRLFQCAVCRRQTSVTAGTIFHKTRTPLRHWFWMIFQVARDKGGASSVKLAGQLNAFQSTVWNQLQKLRHAMGGRDSDISLAGFIELDEAVIGPQARKTGRRRREENDKKGPRPKRLGSRKNKPGKTKTQTEVIVMVERENAKAGNLAMKVIYKTTRDDLREAVEQRVEQNRQSFKTDACQSHFVLRSMGHELEALVLGGSPLSVEELPIVHRAISLLKRCLLGTYHGISARYLQRYLNEFAFRWNRRDAESTMCASLLRAACFALPMTYAELKL